MQHQRCYQDDAVLHPSFLSECITPRSFTEARRAGLLSRAPVKSSFIGVPQWHLLAPNSEPGLHAIKCARQGLWRKEALGPISPRPAGMGGFRRAGAQA